MLLYSCYLIVLSYFILQCSLSLPTPPSSSLPLSISMCRASNPQLSSQQRSCQCEIEMWGTFPCPGLSTHPIRVSHTDASTGSLFSPSVLAEAAASCHWRFIQPKPPVALPHQPVPLPSITAHQLTHAHRDIFTDCLIANEARGRDWCVAPRRLTGALWNGDDIEDVRDVLIS